MSISPFSVDNSAAVGGISLLVGVVGFVGTALGLFLTYRQAREARSAAEASSVAVNAFKLKLSRYTAYNDLALVVQAFDAARRHAMNEAWRDVSDSFETGRQAIVRLLTSEVVDIKEQIPALGETALEMLASNNKIDAAMAGKGSYPNSMKIVPSMRKRHDFLLTLQTKIAKDI